MKQIGQSTCLLLKLSAMCLGFAPTSSASPIYLATDQTGAQTQIDANHTSTWLMTPTIDFDFGGGLFTMKSGNNTSAPVTFNLFQGMDSSGSMLASVNLSNTEFCAQVSNCGQFALHGFLFESPLPILAGTPYFAELISTAGDIQSQAYFIKSNSFFIADQNGNQIEPQPAIFNSTPINSVPEPGSMEMFGVGLVIMIVGSEIAKIKNFPRPTQRTPPKA